MYTHIDITEADFEVNACLAKLALAKGKACEAGAQAGALVSFVGYVRNALPSEDGDLQHLWIEHYPGMTEKILHQEIASAQQQWPLLGAVVIHRIGSLVPGAQIVLVATASAHRQAAFAATAYLTECLKSTVPFWKKEVYNKLGHWLSST